MGLAEMTPELGLAEMTPELAGEFRLKPKQPTG